MGAAQAAFIRFGDGGVVPNNPDLPVMLVRGALPGRTSGEICRHFEAQGWEGTWTYTVFLYHHFHPDAHEALCVAHGWADLVLGGPEVGQTVRVEAGDLVVLPAGTGHRRIDSSPDFAICGSYPPGQGGYSTMREEAGALARYGAEIAAVALPATDPVLGADGPLVAGWAKKGEAQHGA